MLVHKKSEPLICIDLWISGAIRAIAREVLEVSLNPFDHLPADSQSLSDKLARFLDAALSSLGASHIRCLVQSSGVYWSGPFLSMSNELRRTLMGVNVFGRVELLTAVLATNSRRGVENSEVLTQIDVGAIHAMDIRAGRALYGASKSFGIDLSSGMVAGQEIRRAVYFAPGPVDTHMLHRNHWVVKSGGSPELIETLRRGDPQTYRSVFVDGAIEELEKCDGSDNRHLTRIFSQYCEHRRTAFGGPHGVLDRGECAEMMLELIASDSGNDSGIYTADRPFGRVIRRTFVPFGGRGQLDLGAEV
jgi:hypothetical protein